MKKKIVLLFFVAFIGLASGQNNDRLQQIRTRLELIANDNDGLNEKLKTQVNINNVNLQNFLIGVSNLHKINLNVDPSLSTINIVNNFADVSLVDLFVFLCKEYNLTIDFTGAIMSIKKYQEPVVLPAGPPLIVDYDSFNDHISIDVKSHSVAQVFREIMNKSDKNLLFSKAITQMQLQVYLKNVSFATAMEQIAATNNLSYSKSDDGFYLFDTRIASRERSTGARLVPRNTRDYEVLDTLRRTLKVNFNKTPIASVVADIGYDLGLNMYYATSLENAGALTFKTNMISFDDLLVKIFEGNQSQSSAVGNTTSTTDNRNSGYTNSQGRNTGATSGASRNGSGFTFKKEGNVYFFGTQNQLSVRTMEVVQLMHRAIELWGDPSGGSGGSRSNQSRNTNNRSSFNNSSQNGNFQNQGLNGRGNSGYSNQTTSPISNRYSPTNTKSDTFDSIIPDEIKEGLDIKIDYELNSFLVTGSAANVNRFKNFIRKIDRPVPYVLIEVMIVEVNKSAVVETGISWGIGKEAVETQGAIFPSADVTFGAKTINRIIGGFDGFGSFNVGSVIPNFFAKVKALEESGNIKIRSTPKLSTLNGHRAHMSIGETTYYVVTQQSYYGSQIPQSSEIKNYEPIHAELGLSIKPIVSGDGQVTLDINVVQSDFNGKRIDKEAPPGLNSREFSSIIRMRDQDVAVLGGLEEKKKNDSGSGVPLLSRIPIIKWLFSSKKREDSKRKLTIIIKPTIIY